MIYYADESIMYQIGQMHSRRNGRLYPPCFSYTLHVWHRLFHLVLYHLKLRMGQWVWWSFYLVVVLLGWYVLSLWLMLFKCYVYQCPNYDPHILSTRQLYSILCGQPMSFVAPTGLTLAFISGLFRFCTLRDLPFFPVYAWVGLWTSMKAKIAGETRTRT